MANDLSGKSEKELALWMLDRMRDSKEFLGVIRAARSAGGTDILDTPGYVARHKSRLAPIYQGEHEDTIDAPDSVVATLEKLAARDLLSCNEELIEMALAAYIAQHPKGDAGLPKDWQTTIELARAEIEGHIQGAFKPGFMTELATAARGEIARQSAADKSRGSGRDGRSS